MKNLSKRYNIEYDHEEYREKAFVICNNNKYEGGLHFECMIDILGEQGCDTDDMFELDDEEIKDLMPNYIIGETAIIEGEKIIIAYNIEDIEEIKKHYEGTIVLFHKYSIYDI